MGASWGGLGALERVLGGLPRSFRTPIAVAQHRSPDGSSEGLARLLAAHAAMPVVDAEDKQPIEPGTVYLAPPDYHLYVEPDGFALSVDDAVLYSRPSIDVLFESAADQTGLAVLGVVLTGSNEDGAAGAAALAASGAPVLVQDPATAESPVAPRAALARVPGAEVVPLPEIAGRITAWVRG
jgi:two-component system chemotaxis response regulator CheB